MVYAEEEDRVVSVDKEKRERGLWVGGEVGEVPDLVAR